MKLIKRVKLPQNSMHFLSLTLPPPFHFPSLFVSVFFAHTHTKIALLTVKSKEFFN